MESSNEVSWLNNRFADFFYLLHVTITLFCGLMWAGPYEWMWWGVFILYGLTEILWFFRNEYCILTDIERWFRKVPRPESASQQNFIKRIVYQILRVDIEPEFARTITKIWGVSAWLIASLRIFIL